MARGEPSEWSEQCAVIHWARMNECRYPCLKWLHASLNGVKLTRGQALKAKASGMVAGILDLALDFPAHGYHGLRIEMKYGNNSLTQPQREYMDYLKSQGYLALCCYGFEKTVQAIGDYLDNDILDIQMVRHHM